MALASGCKACCCCGLGLGGAWQVNALKSQGIYEKTALILCSKHGNSPINHTTLVRVSIAKLTAAINAGISGTVASSNADTGAYIWLTNGTAANVQACTRSPAPTTHSLCHQGSELLASSFPADCPRVIYHVYH